MLSPSSGASLFDPPPLLVPVLSLSLYSCLESAGMANTAHRPCLCTITQSHSHTLTHSHTLLITFTCCYDEIKGSKDQDFSYSFSDSLSCTIHIMLLRAFCSCLSLLPSPCSCCLLCTALYCFPLAVPQGVSSCFAFYFSLCVSVDTVLAPKGLG